MASQCKKCGSKENYNFVLNIGLCNPCIGERIEELEVENKQLRDWLIEERLPNFCTGVECGCTERVSEARRMARIKLSQELEQALNPPKQPKR